jgi:hypothetical protein
MTRPNYYPYHDVQQSNIILPQNSLFILNGYPVGYPVPSADHNGKFNSNYQWVTYLDQGTLRNDDWLSSDNVALSSTTLQYSAGNVTTTGAPVKFYATYLINNKRVEIDDAALNGIGADVQGSPLLYPLAIKPGRIWVYTTSSGTVRFESVAPATVDAPAGSEITLVGIDIDALGDVTDGNVVPVTLPLPTKQLTITTPLYAVDLTLSGALAVAGNLDVSGDVNLGSTPANTAAVNGSLIVAGSTTCNGDVILGTTFADALIVPATATFQSPVYFNGNVDLGNAAADALTVNATATFNAPVTVANGQLFTANGNVILGNAGGDTIALTGSISCVGNITISSHSITGTAGSLVDVENVAVTAIRFDDSGMTLPGTAGYVHWNGTFFSFMDGASQIHTFDEPMRGYDATLATAANPLTDTTAGATRRVRYNEPVWIEMGSHVLTDSAGSNANYMLRITGPLGVSDVLTSSIVMASASKGYTWHEYIRWTPTDSWPAEAATQNYAFLVRMGTSAGNLTADRIGIKISSAAQV